MGPVWKVIRNVKDACSQCGVEIVDFPSVGTVVDYHFHPAEKFCWACYRYNSALLDEIDPRDSRPYQPVTRPIVP